jgi:hypothetical protein
LKIAVYKLYAMHYYESMSKKLDAEIQRRLAVELAHLMRAIINENPTYVLECYEALGKELVDWYKYQLEK